MQHQSLQGATGQLNPPHQATAGTSVPTVFVMVDNEKKETMFAKNTATGLSIVQIISGIASFIAQITIIVFITPDINQHWIDYDVSGIGEGIYCGVFFIIAGGLGLLASRKPSICTIGAFMTLSIIASIFSGIQIIMASIKLGYMDGYNGTYLLWKEPKMALLSIIILAGVVDMVVAIICAAICCGAFCCSGNGASSGRVVYLTQGENGLGATPLQISGGVPVQIAYLPQATPVTGVMDQILKDHPSYGDVVKGGQEETKEKSANGGYMRI